MEPQQARLTLAVFLAFSAAIVFNALFMQKDAGFVKRAVYPNISLKNDRPFSASSNQKLEGSELLRAIRRELASRNYFPGNASSRLDGRVDAMTMGAIMAFQYDSGLQVTGLVSEGLLKSFLFGVDDAAGLKSGAPRMSAETHPLVAEIQGILSAKGYYDGKIDGIFKGRTMEAVRRFERDRGLPVTGRISGLLVQELSRLTGVAFTASQK